MAAKKEKKENFEANISRLEEIVSLLEKGDISLEKSIELFEEGTAISLKCNKILNEAEQKIVLITKDNEEINETQFDGE